MVRLSSLARQRVINLKTKGSSSTLICKLFMNEKWIACSRKSKSTFWRYHLTTIGSAKAKNGGGKKLKLPIECFISIDQQLEQNSELAARELRGNIIISEKNRNGYSTTRGSAK